MLSNEYLDFITIFLKVVGNLFILYLLGYSLFLFLSVTVGSSVLYKKKQMEKYKNTLIGDYYLPISLIVPAYNEEVTVVETIESLLALDYPIFEIIVVDDGSDDQTSDKIIDHFHMFEIKRPIRKVIPCKQEKNIYECNVHNRFVTLVRKENGGKADALNMGINVSNYPYFVCIDADSVLQYDSLSKIIRPVLEDRSVVAVGGAVRPSNNVILEKGRVKKYRLPDKIIPAMQVLEYDRSFLASRILLDTFNGNLIISGAFGLFNKSKVIECGGYDANTMGEDMELVVKLHEYCRMNEIEYKIKYEPDAICYSQVPGTLKDLCKQRKRWHIGLFQSMFKHKNIFMNIQFGSVGFISYLYFLIYELFSPFIEVFGIFTVLLAYMYDLLNVPFMIIFYLIYLLFGTTLSLTAFFARIHTIDLKLSFTDICKAIGLCIFEVSVLRFIIACVRTLAIFGKKNKWGKMKRVKIEYLTN